MSVCIGVLQAQRIVYEKRAIPRMHHTVYDMWGQKRGRRSVLAKKVGGGGGAGEGEGEGEGEGGTTSGPDLSAPSMDQKTPFFLGASSTSSSTCKAPAHQSARAAAPLEGLLPIQANAGQRGLRCTSFDRLAQRRHSLHKRVGCCLTTSQGAGATDRRGAPSAGRAAFQQQPGSVLH